MGFFKKIMDWINEVEEEIIIEEIIDPPLSNRSKSTSGDFEAKIQFQYPTGKFRFPVVPDTKLAERVEVQDRNPKPKPKLKPKPRKEVKATVNHLHQTPVAQNKEVRKPIKTATGPFKRTEIPSPIYGFNRPKIRGEATTNPIVYELCSEPLDYTSQLACEEQLEKIVPVELNPLETEQSPFISQPENVDQNQIEEPSTMEEWKASSKNVVIPEALAETIDSPKELYEEAEEQEEQEEQEAEEYEEHVGSFSANKVEDSVSEIKINTTDENQKPRRNLPFNVLMLKSDKKKQEIKKTIVPVVNSDTSNDEPNNDGYERPPLSILKPKAEHFDDVEWLEEQSHILDETLQQFGVRAQVVHYSQGPAVTRFEIQPEPGVKVSKITNLSDDLKLSLAARDIRIEAPIPGKRMIGIEIPNRKTRPVFLREILEGKDFYENSSPLTVAVGLDISGVPVSTDLKKMPHGLIAGSTGSGKSVFINSMLISLLYKSSPADVRLLLIDPKMVELAPYNAIPHLVTPVITDVKAATASLKWAVDEMERRYELFAHSGARDIVRYNEKVTSSGLGGVKLPYIVIIIDELADLMMMSPTDVEESICRIAQKARACGIHLIVATQRPSVDVITGLIKANIPTRIAFSVSAQTDSRTILDQGGAERLLGKGDMLFMENGTSKSVRLQGTYVTDDEIESVVHFVQKLDKPPYLFEQEELLKAAEPVEELDDLFAEVCEFVVDMGGASTSSIQRRFRIGYNRAARLIDLMEVQGIISEAKGSKPRDVLISTAELQLIQNSFISN